MFISLGQNPNILIILIFLELLLIIIPAFIAHLITKKEIIEEIKEMGFRKTEDFSWNNIFKKVLFGLIFGIIIFLIAGYILLFFKNILVENMLGTEFTEFGESNSISTIPISPNLIQLIIIIILQIMIIGPCEEGFFRGFIMKKSELKFKKAFSVLLSSACFTFYHVPPFLVPIYTIITFFGYYFTIGIILSLIFIYFNYSLVPCSIAHSIFNILIIIF